VPIVPNDPAGDEPSLEANKEAVQVARLAMLDAGALAARSLRPTLRLVSEEIRSGGLSCRFKISAGNRSSTPALRLRSSSFSILAERNFGTLREAARTENEEEEQTRMQCYDPQSRKRHIDSRKKEQRSGNVAVDSPAPCCIGEAAYAHYGKSGHP
jgi:hypothetical protein